VIGILGGGLSGVALASFLKQPSMVFEAEDRLGGLCRTFTKDGFSTDLGGHILFSRDPALLDLTTAPLGENVHTRRRENRIAYNGRIINWPFENGLGGLDREEAAELVLSYLEAGSHIGECVGGSFEMWAVDRFGDAMARAFLIPYTEKVFKLPARELASDWSTRVPRPPVADVVRSAMGIETVGYQHQAEFRYPREGGIEALVRSLPEYGMCDPDGAPRYEKCVRYHVGCKVERVQHKGARWVINGRHECDQLVSTIPLAELVRAIAGQGPVLEAAHALRWNSVITVTFGLMYWHGSVAAGCTALYSADPTIRWHRACFNRAFSDAACPPGGASVTCEVTGEWQSFGAVGDGELTVECWDGLVKTGVVQPRNEPAVVMMQGARHAYPVPTLDCARNRETVLSYLESIGIHSLGRAGRHEYKNMDECVRAAQELARELDQ
jgi:protoporphyrinogen oxidase